MKYTVNSIDSLSVIIGKLREIFKEKKFFQVSIHTGKARTLSQNALQHVWYGQVSKEEGEFTPLYIRCLCKLKYALPILRAEDEEYNAICCKVIDPLPYESKVAAMEYLPATSLMKTDQLSRYLEHVQAHYVGRVELEFPPE